MWTAMLMLLAGGVAISFATGFNAMAIVVGGTAL